LIIAFSVGEMIPQNKTGGALQAARSRKFTTLSVAHRTVSATGIDPVPLDEEICVRQRDVVDRSVRSGLRSAERPGALVGVLGALAVIPGIEIRI
jgi:hypothetical protein